MRSPSLCLYATMNPRASSHQTIEIIQYSTLDHRLSWLALRVSHVLSRDIIAVSSTRRIPGSSVWRASPLASSALPIAHWPVAAQRRRWILPRRSAPRFFRFDPRDQGRCRGNGGWLPWKLTAGSEPDKQAADENGVHGLSAIHRLESPRQLNLNTAGAGKRRSETVRGRDWRGGWPTLSFHVRMAGMRRNLRVVVDGWRTQRDLVLLLFLRSRLEWVDGPTYQTSGSY